MKNPTGLTQKSIICPQRFSDRFPKHGFLYSSCLSFTRQLSLPQICPTHLQSLEFTQVLLELFITHIEHLCKLEKGPLTSRMHPCSGHIAFWEERGLDVSLLIPIICTILLYLMSCSCNNSSGHMSKLCHFFIFDCAAFYSCNYYLSFTFLKTVSSKITYLVFTLLFC